MSTLQERLRSMAASVDGVSEGLAAELVDFLRQAADALDAEQAAYAALAADFTSTKDALDAAEARYREEYVIVDRVWKALGVTGYDGGPEISERVKALKERAEQAERELAEARAREQRLREALEHVLPYVEQFRGGWSTHTHGGYNSGELADQIKEALRPIGGEPGGKQR